MTTAKKTRRLVSVGAATIVAVGAAAAIKSHRARLEAQAAPFHLQEATIDEVHRAISAGQVTCQGLVQAYLNRAKAYNGVSNALVTMDGAPIPEATGAVRAGAPLKFPTIRFGRAAARSFGLAD
jgi:hypothetical protein